PAITRECWRGASIWRRRSSKRPSSPWRTRRPTSIGRPSGRSIHCGPWPTSESTLHAVRGSDRMDDIFLLSITHHTAPLALRERLSLDRAAQRRLLGEAHAFVAECVAIVTCNRTELYAVSDRPDAQ